MVPAERPDAILATGTEMRGFDAEIAGAAEEDLSPMRRASFSRKDDLFCPPHVNCELIQIWAHAAMGGISATGL
jgi:hypothetical protein